MHPTPSLLEPVQASVRGEVFGWLERCNACEELSDVSDLRPLQGYACWKCGAPMAAMKRLGNLELLALLGVGGMGGVYRAKDTVLDRTVAVKLLVGQVTKDPARREALRREAMMTASIAHPHVVKIYDAGAVGETCYVVMELLEHGTLEEAIDRSKALPEADVLTFGVQVADGLRAAWRKGLLHRDIKPANILFDDPQTAKVADFGLALPVGEAARAEGALWGSPHYVSPERAAGRPEDLRSDIYSLGATLFHALAGRAPFEGDDPDNVARKRMSSPAPSVRTFALHVTESTAAVLAKALQRQPEDRFQDYDEFIKALETSGQALANRVRRTLPAASRPGSQPTEQPVGKRRSRQAFALAVILAAGCLGAIAWMQDWIPHGFGARAQNSPGAAGAEEAAFRSFAEPYSAARTEMLRGEFATAAASFAKIGQNSKAPAAARDWSRFNEGLSWLFAGDLPKATEVFQSFEPDPQESRDGARAFLAQTARQCAGGAALPKVLASGVDHSSGQALGLLAYGLVDWNLHDYDDAEALLRQFRTAGLSDASWIKACQSLTDPYLKELSAVAELEAFKRNGTRAAQLEALARLREALNDFRPTSPLLAIYRRALELRENEPTGNTGSLGASKNCYEAENLIVQASSGQTLTDNADPGFSNGHGMIFAATAIGNYVTFIVPKIAAFTTYDVRFGVKKCDHAGIVQMAIGSAVIVPTDRSSPQDLYSPTAEFVEMNAGMWTPGTTSDKYCQFTVTGKNASSSGYTMAIDYIKLIPQKRKP